MIDGLVAKIHASIEKIPITTTSWLLSFGGIVLVRIFLEQFSSFQRGRYLLIDLPTLVHYSVFYLATTLCIMAVLMLAAKKNLKEIATLCIFGLFIIWLPPLIDLLFAGEGGFVMAYLFVPEKELVVRFFSFFGGQISSGITLGIRVEIALIIIASILYVKVVTKSILRALLSAAALYAIIFSLCSLPSIINIFLPKGQFLWQFSGGALYQSISLSHIIIGNVHPQYFASNEALLDLGFNKAMAGVNIIIALCAGMLVWFMGYKEKFLAVMKNCRPERMIHYLLLIIFGLVLSGKEVVHGWVDMQILLLTLISFASAWIYSVCQNDLYDQAIDVMTSPTRPLISGRLLASEMISAGNLFLLISALAAYSAGQYVVFFTGFFIVLYHIYSIPPLRLKRFIPINSILIGLACLCAVLAGYFLMSPDKDIVSFPGTLAIGIVVLFAVASSVRDIKDVEGDRAHGIQTLPTLLGMERAKKIIASSICLFFLASVFYFKLAGMFLPAIISAPLCFYFITAKEYKEWKFFIVYLSYLVLFIFAIAAKS